jgi:hypothetical protein
MLSWTLSVVPNGKHLFFRRLGLEAYGPCSIYVGLFYVGQSLYIKLLPKIGF